MWLEGRLDLKQASDPISAMPAYIFGLGAAKGVLQPGADNDLTLYDPIVDTTVGDRLRHAAQSLLRANLG
jgi:dihydroorotase-like cyclic amidohydrolase